MKSKESRERFLSKQASYIVGKALVHLFSEGNKVAYTHKSTNKIVDIYVSDVHPLFCQNKNGQISEKLKILYQLGATTHECGHHLYTNFDYIDEKMDELQKQGKANRCKTYHSVINICEDPAEEYLIHFDIEGKAITALDALIYRMYQSSGKLDDYPADAANADMHQVLNALIMVGDRGTLKGRFHTKRAKDTFAKVLPIFTKCCVEPDNKKRVDAAMEIADIIWSIVDEPPKEDLPKGEPRPGSGSGKNPNPNDQDSNDAGSSVARLLKRREKLNRKYDESSSKGQSGEKSDDAKNDGTPSSGSSGSPDKDDTDEEAEQESKNGDCKSNDKSDKDSDDKSNGQSGEQSNDRPEDKDDDKGSGSGNDGDDTDDEGNESEEDEEADSELEKAAEEAAEVIENELKKLEKAIERENSAEDVRKIDLKTDLPENPLVDRMMPTYSDYHIRLYESIVQKYRSRISTLVQSLKTIFKADRERKQYSTNGCHLSIKRITDAKLHESIMQKRTAPNNIGDFECYITCDISGSTSTANKYVHMYTACICLYEAMKALKIPVTVTGYTTGAYKTIIQHYVSWNSDPDDKYRIATITPQSCNCDYDAINDAVLNFSKRPSRHKLLIVISDGLPCSRAGIADAFKETGKAVENARKKGVEVFAVGVGVTGIEEYNDMYGKDRALIKSADEIFSQTVVCLKHIFQRGTK